MSLVPLLLLLTSIRTYPNGVFQVTDSFYWRGTVSYDQDGTTKTVSNIGPSSAPGYIEWRNRVDMAWLPPSPLPDHDAWPNMTTDVDPNDPYGHNYVFVHNKDCMLDMDYMLQYFHEPAISAEWSSCRPPTFICTDGLIWVETVKYLLDSTTIHKKAETTSTARPLDVDLNQKTTDDRTEETKTRETKTRTGIKTRTRIRVEETPTPPTRTAAPGSTVPHTTPRETEKTDNTHRTAATPKATDSLRDHESVERTRDRPKDTKTRTRHNDEDGNQSTKNRELDPPHNTIRPEDTHSSNPVISIGTERITQNSDSEYIYSSRTLTPGGTITIGSGSSATTVAISTSGSATFVIVDKETSRIRASPRPTSSPEFIIGSKTFKPGSSVVVSGTTYSVAPDGSTVFIDGEPHSITLGGQTWVTTLADDTLLTKTVVPQVEAGAITSSADGKNRDKAINKVTSTPQLLFGTQTLSIGSSVVISGTTYSLGQSGSVVYIDGKPTTLDLEDQTTVVTLPNGVVATETEATITLLLPSSSGVSSTIPTVTQASKASASIGVAWLHALVPAALIIVLIL